MPKRNGDVAGRAGNVQDAQAVGARGASQRPHGGPERGVRSTPAVDPFQAVQGLLEKRTIQVGLVLDFRLT